MTAAEALHSIELLNFDTKSRIPFGSEQIQITGGRGIKLYRKGNDIFGMVGINLPTLITSRDQARVSVRIAPRAQTLLVQMAETVATNYPHALSEGVFDFCLHARLEMNPDGKALNLVESDEWEVAPAMQYKVRSIKSNHGELRATASGGVRTNFNNPQHLTAHFLGDSKFGFAVNLEEEDGYHLGRQAVYPSISELFAGIGKTPKCLEIGQNPHLPTVESRLKHLADVLNTYARKEQVTSNDVGNVLEFYNQLASGNATAPAQPVIAVVVTDDSNEEGW